MTAIEKFQAMADRKPNFLAGEAGYEIRKEYTRKRKEMSPEQEKAIKLWLSYRHTVVTDRITILPLLPFGTRVEYSILFPGEHTSRLFSGKRAGKRLTDIQESEF